MEYLYHYTNIEALALILSNRTIRFSSLERVDDLQEKQAADIRNIGQFCYVSSWTDEEKESIPMWKMYSSLEGGVRLKMHKYPFHEFCNDPDSLRSTGMRVEDGVTDGDYPKSVIPYAEFINKGFTQQPPLQKDMLFQVEYTDDHEKLVPRLLSDNRKTINTGMLGKYKNTHWSFQKEWRYIFTLYPIDVKKINPSDDTYVQDIYYKLLSGNLKSPFDFFDLSISEDAFEDMEVTMGPRISKGNEVIVRSLLEKYNRSAMLKESSLVGKI